MNKEQAIVAIVIGVFCLLRVVWGLRTGEVGWGWKRHEREETPFGFWLDIGGCFILGIFSLGAAACYFIPALAPYGAKIAKLLHLG